MKTILLNKVVLATCLTVALGLGGGLVVAANTVDLTPVPTSTVSLAETPTGTQTATETIEVTPEATHTEDTTTITPDVTVPANPVSPTTPVVTKPVTNKPVITPTNPVTKPVTTPKTTTPVKPVVTEPTKPVVVTPTTPVVVTPPSETVTETPVVEEEVVVETPAEETVTETPVTETPVVEEEVVIETEGEVGEASSFEWISASDEIRAAYNGDYSQIVRNTENKGMSGITYSILEDGRTQIVWSSGAYNATVIVSSADDVTNFVIFVNTVLRAMAYQA